MCSIKSQIHRCLFCTARDRKLYVERHFDAFFRYSNRKRTENDTNKSNGILSKFLMSNQMNGVNLIYFNEYNQFERHSKCRFIKLLSLSLFVSKRDSFKYSFIITYDSLEIFFFVSRRKIFFYIKFV